MRIILTGTLIVLAVLPMTVSGQQVTSRPPVVLTMAVPRYPYMARLVNIGGEVDLTVTTDGERVTRVVVVEKAHPLLDPAAADHVKSWTFQAHEATTFNTTYVFRIDSDMPDGGRTAITLELPFYVEMAAGRHEGLSEPPFVTSPTLP